MSLGLTELRVCWERFSGTFPGQPRGAVTLSGETYASWSRRVAPSLPLSEAERVSTAQSHRGFFLVVCGGRSCLGRGREGGEGDTGESESVTDLPPSGRELAPFRPEERPGPVSLELSIFLRGGV